MKIKLVNYLVLYAVILFSILFSCKKEDIKVVQTIPSVTIGSITNITAYSATCIAEIISDGGSAVVARGICWSLNNPTPTTEDSNIKSGTGSGSFTNSIVGLTQGANYYVRAYATNGIGTVYSSQVIFSTTKAYLPTITNAVSTIAITTATSGGNITNDGGSPITSRGVCWNTSRNPTTANLKTTDGTGTGAFISSLTGLTANTTYYLRSYATNSVGTGYGSEIPFRTYTTGSGTVIDIDGNVYHTVTIGTQVWMVENLKTTKYRNGDPIPNVTDGTAWHNNIAGAAYCNYNNDINSSTTYGRLYNGFAVADSHNIAPIGWHIPTDTEWTTLANYLGGESVAGGKLKETGTTYWQSPNTGATNETSFTALPGGNRFWDGSFGNVGNRSAWWSSTEKDINNFWSREIHYDGGDIGRNFLHRLNGYSVRCVRD